LPQAAGPELSPDRSPQGNESGPDAESKPMDRVTSQNVFQANSIPAELAALPQWVLWRYETRDGKLSKVPHTFMGYRASDINPEHWSTLEFALKFATKPGFAAGLGFVFTADDPYCGTDLDHVWQSDADEGAPWALRILERFSDTYHEISPSGTGMKIWCKAKAPRCGRWKIGRGAIEIYDRKRFFTVTGRGGPAHIANHQDDIELLVANLDDRGDRSRRTAAPPIGAIIPAGERHNSLVSLAGTLVRRGVCQEGIEALLHVVNQKQCVVPKPAEEIRRIVQSTERWQR
jgi:primase-polymerase (primpol)-like protein